MTTPTKNESLPELPSQGELDRCERLLTACTCIDDYKLRDRTDPQCEACNLGAEVIDTFRELREYATLTREAPTEAVSYVSPETFDCAACDGTGRVGGDGSPIPCEECDARGVIEVTQAAPQRQSAREVAIVCDWKDADPFPRFIEAEVNGCSVSLDWRDREDGLKELIVPVRTPSDYPECSGDPASCPENEGYGCCKPNPQRLAQGDAQFADNGADADCACTFLLTRDGLTYCGDCGLTITQPPHQDRGEVGRLFPDWFMFIDEALRDTMSRHKIDPLDGDMVLIANALEDAQRWARERAEAALTEAKQQEGAEWTEKEQRAIAEMMAAQELSYPSLLRQAVRLYQYDWHRRRDGETCTWSGDEQRAREFYTPPPQGEAAGRHWVHEAAQALRPYVSCMDVIRGHCGREHLLSMLDRMRDEQMSDTKACRWLGWIQCALVEHRIASLDEMKQHNAKFAAMEAGAGG